MSIDLSKVKPAAQVKGLIEFEVRDKDGKLIKKHAQPMRSFTANFLRYLANLFSTYYESSGSYCSGGPTKSLVAVDFPIQVYDTSNTATTLSVAVCGSSVDTVRIGLMYVKAGPGEDSYGLVVGQGTTQPSPNDYAMENPFTHGSSANQLSYGDTSIEEPSITNNTITLRIIRTFTNNYSSAQTVSEVGLIAKHTINTYATCGSMSQEASFLIARDIVDPPVSVPSGSTLTVRYVISVTM